MRKINTISALLLFVLLSLPLAAQETDLPPGERLLERLDRIFQETSPPLGAKLPNITLHDATGKKFRLRNLKGQYTVLLFGCLT
jgi:cytochrome oxidase Cu insertion factor (SCO1/SenC/PrrC family)